jgi:long-chain acyl-CoA synthetase
MDPRKALARLIRNRTGLELVDRRRRVSADELSSLIAQEQERLAGVPEGPVFVALHDRTESFVRWCALVAAGLRPVVLPMRIPPAELDLLRRSYPTIPYASPSGLVQPDGSAAVPPEVSDPYLLVIPTSGSTGAARLIAASGEAVSHGIDAIAASQGLDEVRSTGLLLPPHYSFALVNQVLWSLARGAKLVFTPGLATPGDTVAILRDEHVEMVCLVGRQMRALVRLGFDREEYALPAVKIVNFAGGPFPFDCYGAIRRLFPNARVMNNYGCTEAFPRVSAREVHAGDEPVMDVGRPIRTIEVSIHDESGVRLAADTVGLIRARGPSAALGFLRPDGSVHPFSDDGSFPTGDQGLITQAGTLHVFGRADQVINVGGERVSLLKIEAVLRLHPRVEDAIVAGIREPDGEQWPLGCISGPETPSRAEILRHLTAHLPGAAWPRRIFHVSDWPLLPNGKPDRKLVLDAARAGTLTLVWQFNQAV